MSCEDASGAFKAEAAAGFFTEGQAVLESGITGDSVFNFQEQRAILQASGDADPRCGTLPAGFPSVFEHVTEDGSQFGSGEREVGRDYGAAEEGDMSAASGGIAEECVSDGIFAEGIESISVQFTFILAEVSASALEVMAVDVIGEEVNMVVDIMSACLSLGDEFLFSVKLVFEHFALRLGFFGLMFPINEGDCVASDEVSGADKEEEYGGDGEADSDGDIKDEEDEGRDINGNTGEDGEGGEGGPAFPRVIWEGVTDIKWATIKEPEDVDGHKGGTSGDGSPVAAMEEHLGGAAGEGKGEEEDSSIGKEDEEVFPNWPS